MDPSVGAVPGGNIEFVLCTRGMRMSTSLNGFEVLEDRVLLAGNVTVAVNAAGDLVITGDNASNQIVIADFDGDGFADVMGLNGTAINGVVNGTEFTGALPVTTPFVVINLQGGNDELTIDDSNDGATIFGAGVGGSDFRVDMGAGNDRIVAIDDGTGVGINLNSGVINLGAGNDVLDDNTVGADIDVLDLTINAGAGNDVVRLDTGALRVDNLAINMGAGSDVVVLDGLFGSTGANVETLSLTFGAGADNLSINNVQADRTGITLGAGRDSVLITNSIFDLGFRLRGNGGRDEVGVGGNQFNGSVEFRGGGGRDTLFDLGGNTGVSRNNIRSFRIVTV